MEQGLEFPIYDSGFKLIAVVYRSDRAIAIRFCDDANYSAGDRLTLGIEQLRNLIGEEDSDEQQSAQDN